MARVRDFEWGVVRGERVGGGRVRGMVARAHSRREGWRRNSEEVGGWSSYKEGGVARGEGLGMWWHFGWGPGVGKGVEKFGIFFC